MTTEPPSGTPEEVPPPTPPQSQQPTPPPDMPPEHDDAAVLEGAGDFTSGEGLVAFAGMLLLVLWLIFDVILDDYGQGFVTLLLAVIVVVVPRIDPVTVEKFHPVALIMKIAGYGFGLFLLFEIFFILDNGFPDGALPIIAALLTLAAFAMGFVGARQIEI